MSDEAKERYGNLEGVSELQALLAGKKVGLTKTKHLRKLSPSDFFGAYCNFVDLYAVDVVEGLGDIGRSGSLIEEPVQAALLNVEVKCCYRFGMIGAPTGDFPAGDAPDSQHCQISKLTAQAQ